MDESGGGIGALVVVIILIIYWLSPADLIPDGLPIGYLDDIVVTLLSGAGMLKAQV